MGNFFTDVIQKSPLYNSVNRVASLDLLEPTFRQKVEAVIADAASHGHTLMVYETYRSQARQQQLFMAGATKLRTVGVHHYGLAADIVFEVGGEPSWKGDFGFLGQLAHVHQLVWGGNWGLPPSHPISFHDNDHVQWCSLAKQGDLFRGTWYPTPDYNPYNG